MAFPLGRGKHVLNLCRTNLISRRSTAAGCSRGSPPLSGGDKVGVSSPNGATPYAGKTGWVPPKKTLGGRSGLALHFVDRNGAGDSFHRDRVQRLEADLLDFRQPPGGF